MGHLDIDAYSLDSEWVQQANLYQDAIKLEAEALRELNDAKEKLLIRKAQIELDYRSGKGVDSDLKITDKAIDALLNANVELINLRKLVNKNKEEYDILSGFVTALEHKKKALENLVTLHVNGYYAEPREKQNGAVSNYMSDKQRERLNRRKSREKEDE